MSSSPYCRCLTNILSSIKSMSLSARPNNQCKAQHSQTMDKQTEKKGKQNSNGRQIENATCSKSTRPIPNISQTTKNDKQMAQNSKHKSAQQKDEGVQLNTLQLRQNGNERTQNQEEHVEATDRPFIHQQPNNLRGTALSETEGQVFSQNNDLSQSLSQEQTPQQESQLPTEKSEIIMNDIGKGIDLNENDFLFDQRHCYTNEEQFQQLYRKIQPINHGKKYDQWLVQKISTESTFKAFILNNLMEQLRHDSSECSHQYKQEQIDCLFQVEKDHLKSLISLSQLQPHPCPHLISVIDYCIQPPHFTLSQNRKKFNEGQLIVVLEHIDKDLSQYLSEQDLDPSQKQRIIRQMLECISAVHQNGMVLRDFSLKSWKVDKFSNLKFESLSIQSISSNQLNSNNNCNLTPPQNSQSLLYLTPEEPVPQNSHESTLQKSYFHSGFSQISDFDIPEPFVYTSKQDLWKLGVLVFKILTGQYPFEITKSVQDQRLQIIKTLGQKNYHHPNIKTGEINHKNAEKTDSTLQNTKFKTKISKLCHKEVRLVQGLLRLDPKERIECKELLKLQYFNEVLSESLYQIQNHQQ